MLTMILSVLRVQILSRLFGPIACDRRDIRRGEVSAVYFAKKKENQLKFRAVCLGVGG